MVGSPSLMRLPIGLIESKFRGKMEQLRGKWEGRRGPATPLPNAHTVVRAGTQPGQGEAFLCLVSRNKSEMVLVP